MGIRRKFTVFEEFDMKQQKGRDYKPIRQWIDEDKISPQTSIKGEVE